MKTRNIILLGGGAVVAYFLFKKFMKPAPEAPVVTDAPVDTQDANEPKTGGILPPTKGDLTINNIFDEPTKGVASGALSGAQMMTR